MSEMLAHNPFAPGAGTVPEHAPGREQERTVITRALQSITWNRTDKGRLPYTPMSLIKIVGPRGVGKTLLLAEAEEEAKSLGIHVARLSHMEELEDGTLMERLIQEVATEEALKNITKAGGSVAGVGGFIERKAASSTFQKVLENRLGKSPVAFLLDEVQNYDARYLSLVIQLGQQMINSKRPLLMILAGTPELDSYLRRKVKASFLVRSRDIRINLLETQAVREAFSQTCEDYDVPLEDGVLDLMVEATDNYPYFVQAVGWSVWEAMLNSPKEKIDLEIFESAGPVIQEQRNNLYIKIYDEIERAELDSYASQVIEIINLQEGKRVEKRVVIAGLVARNQGMDKEVARTIVDRMLKEGLLWPDKDGQLGPGVPSFFDFISEKEQLVEKQKRVDEAAREKVPASKEYEEALPELDLTEYISPRSFQDDGKGLRVEIGLESSEDRWSPGAEKDGIYRVVMPGGERKVYRLNRIENPRNQPHGMTFQDFHGIILCFGEQTNGGFSDYGKPERSDVINWRNMETTDD